MAANTNYPLANGRVHRASLYLSEAYVLDQAANFPRSVLLQTSRNRLPGLIDRVRDVLVNRIGGQHADWPAIQPRDTRFLIRLPAWIGQDQVVREIQEWAQGEEIPVMVFAYAGVPEQPTPAVSFRVKIRIKNVPLRLWTKRAAERIIDLFGFHQWIDMTTVDSFDRRGIVGTLVCHDPRSIPLEVTLHGHGPGFWGLVQIEVLNWQFDRNPPPQLLSDVQWGRNPQGGFDDDGRARESLYRAGQRWFDFQEFAGAEHHFSDGAGSSDSNWPSL